MSDSSGGLLQLGLQSLLSHRHIGLHGRRRRLPVRLLLLDVLLLLIDCREPLLLLLLIDEDLVLLLVLLLLIDDDPLLLPEVHVVSGAGHFDRLECCEPHVRLHLTHHRPAQNHVNHQRYHAWFGHHASPASETCVRKYNIRTGRSWILFKSHVSEDRKFKDPSKIQNVCGENKKKFFLKIL